MFLPVIIHIDQHATSHKVEVTLDFLGFDNSPVLESDMIQKKFTPQLYEQLP